MPELKFSLDDVEFKRIEKFERDCAESDDDHGGVIGGRFSYEITPTSLGPIIVVKDSVTKREENVTNFDMW